MTTKHTAGPWKAYRTDESNKRLPLTVGMDEGNEAKIFGDNTEANARLIAAAPELLEAIKAVLAETQAAEGFYMEKAFQLLDWLKDHGNDLMRNAIAKATGEPVTQ
jgi:hypothetical protein